MIQTIQSYRFGRMKIDGTLYRQDLKIIRGVVADRWWRSRGHYLSKADLEDILAAAPRRLIVGTGAYGAMQISPTLAQEVADHGIQLIAKPTAEAMTAFNAHYSRYPDTAGAFHLSC